MSWRGHFQSASVAAEISHERLPLLGVCAFIVVAAAPPARADIFQWECIDPADPGQGKRQSATLAPDGDDVDAVPGANLAGRNLTMVHLIGANLMNANGYQTNLTDADLTGANFKGSMLTDADFTNAEIRGTRFINPYCNPAGCLPLGTGLTLAQLYSTANYQAQDLSEIDLSYHYLLDANFAGQNLTDAVVLRARLTNADFRKANLTNADFLGGTLTGANFRDANLANANFAGNFCPRNGCLPDFSLLTFADLTAADARGARDLIIPPSAVTTNLILPDGYISGLNLQEGGSFIVRDYDGDPGRVDPIDGMPAPLPPIAVTIDQHFTMGPAGTLRIVFEADAWDSTISFTPGIPVMLGGTLELTFADDVNPAAQVGRTFDLFDWTSVSPIGTFAVSSPYVWDLSRLYLTGDVTLIAVPEMSCLTLATAAAIGPTFHRRRKIS